MRALGRWRTASRAVDWLAVGLAAASAAALAAYTLAPLAHRVGWIAPIDDAYIHLQYGWELARGQLFRFHPGDPRSTGETSPLYAVLLAALELGRLSRAHLVVGALILGALLLAATLLVSGRAVARATTCPSAAIATIALLAVQGFLSWIFLSGMETGLYLLGLAATLGALASWKPGPPPRALLWAAALLPLARPDGALALGLVVILLLVRRREQGGWPRAAGNAAIVCLPFLLYLSAIRLGTGSFATAGLQMKSIPYLPYLDVATRLSRILDNAAKAWREILLAGRPEFGPSWQLALSAVGWAAQMAREVRARRVGMGGMGFALLIGALLAGAQVGVSQWRGERYQAPTFFLLVLGIGLAIGHLALELPRLRIDIALPIALVLATLPTVGRWQEIFLADAATIRDKQVAAALFVRERLPPDARVLVCDAGALGFLGERWTYDVVGLTTAMQGNSYIGGPGSRFEELEHWPREKWPNYAAVYFWCAWDGAQGRVLQSFDDLAVRELFEPGLGTGEEPTLRHAGFLADTLDVADLTSEVRHRFHEREGGAMERDVVDRRSYAGRADLVADGGRIVTGPVDFVLRGQPRAHSVLVARLQGGPAVTATVRLDGGAPRAWAIPPANDQQWIEPELDLGSPAGRELRVRVDVPPEAKLPLFHLWLFQTPP